MNREDLIAWFEEYDQLKAQNAELKAALSAATAEIKSIKDKYESLLFKQQATEKETDTRKKLTEKYREVSFVGKCTLRQFTEAAHKSLYTGKLPREWNTLFEAYYTELEKPFGLTRTLTCVIGAMPK